MYSCTIQKEGELIPIKMNGKVSNFYHKNVQLFIFYVLLGGGVILCIGLTFHMLQT